MATIVGVSRFASGHIVKFALGSCLIWRGLGSDWVVTAPRIALLSHAFLTWCQSIRVRVSTMDFTGLGTASARPSA